jgi:hypothetical protein
MAKTDANQGQPTRRAATRAFERAWKLLGRLEKRLAAARDEEAKRGRQLAAATGDEIARRRAQLDKATSNAARVAGLLTELSEMIAANARAQAGQTVSDFAHAAAGAVRDEERAKTAAGPSLPRPRTRRPATPPPADSKAAAARRAATRPVAAAPTAAKPAASRPPSAKTPRATAPSSKPAVTRTPTRKPPAAARPRPRRSLQSGTPDPDESSS